MINKSNLLFGLQSKTVDLLNEQIALEHHASAQYLTMASWCDVKGYEGSAKFFYNQADEERHHMLKLFRFLTEADSQVVHPCAKNLISEFKSLRHVFEVVMQSENTVTHAIHKLTDHCLTSKDFSTLNFIQWYVAEQIEEEVTVKRILDLFHVAGEDSIGIYTADRAIGDLVKICK
jgi:ferritin